MKENKVIFIAHSEESLTKEQIQFNILTEKIEKTRLAIDSKELELNEKLVFINEHLSELERSTHKARIDFIKFTFTLLNELNLSKKDEKLIEDYLTLTTSLYSDEGFYDKEFAMIHDAFQINTIEEEKENKNSFLKDMISKEFGDDIDISDIDFTDSSEENMINIMLKLKEAQAKKGENNNSSKNDDDDFANFFHSSKSNGKQKKKTKTQLKKEALEAEKEKLKGKGLKSIYYSLSKALHPDIESDPLKKAEKEELMKQIVKAYEAKDLISLLQLEMQYLFKDMSDLKNLTKEKISIYIDLLKEQLQELESQKNQMDYHPRFEIISDFKNLKLESFKKKIQSIKNQLIIESRNLESLTFPIDKYKENKKNYLAFLKKEVAVYENEMSFGFDLFDFL